MSANKLRIAVRKFDPFEKAIEKIWTSFCEKTGCTLELEAVPFDLHPLYDTTFKDKGLQNGDWDIGIINTDWISEAYHSGAVENLNEFIAKDAPANFPEGWSRSLLYKQEFEGNIVALPFHDGPECMIYRKDLFESETEKANFKTQFGRDLEVPKTWNDLLEVATFFNRPEENLYGTTFAAYPDGHNTVFDFCLQLWTRGGDLFDVDKKICLNSEVAIEGMEFYRSALKNFNAIHPDSRDFDSVKSGMAFAEGTMAMMVNWFGFASMCEVYEGSKVKGKVDVTNVPAGPNGEGVSLNAYWMYVLGKGSTKKQIAYDFMKYAVNPENDKLMTLEGGIGCRKSTWHDTDVNNVVPYYYKLEELHKNTRSLPRKSNWSEIADVIDALVLEVIDTEKDITAILNEAQEKVNIIEK